MELIENQNENMKDFENLHLNEYEFDRRTAMLDDLLQENAFKQKLFNDIYKRADDIKTKFNMSLNDCDDIDYLVSDIISATLKAVTSLKNVVIIV